MKTLTKNEINTDKIYFDSIASTEMVKAGFECITSKQFVSQLSATTKDFLKSEEDFNRFVFTRTFQNNQHYFQLWAKKEVESSVVNEDDFLKMTRVAKSFDDLKLFSYAYAQKSDKTWSEVKITDHIVDGRSAIFNEVSFQWTYAFGISAKHETRFVHQLRVLAETKEASDFYSTEMKDAIREKAENDARRQREDAFVASHEVETVKARDTTVALKKTAQSDQKEEKRASSARITQGHFTLVFEQHNTHRTFRVKTVKEGGLAGKVIIGYLSGSDNESSYTNFGFLNEKNEIVFWRQASTHDRKKVTLDDTKRRRIVSAWRKIAENSHEAGKTYALMSTRCYKCNRLLTHPESIPVGMGPDCASRAEF